MGKEGFGPVLRIPHVLLRYIADTDTWAPGLVPVQSGQDSTEDGHERLEIKEERQWIEFAAAERDPIHTDHMATIAP